MRRLSPCVPKSSEVTARSRVRTIPATCDSRRRARSADSSATDPARQIEPRRVRLFRPRQECGRARLNLVAQVLIIAAQSECAVRSGSVRFHRVSHAERRKCLVQRAELEFQFRNFAERARPCILSQIRPVLRRNSRVRRCGPGAGSLWPAPLQESVGAVEAGAHFGHRENPIPVALPGVSQGLPDARFPLRLQFGNAVFVQHLAALRVILRARAPDMSPFRREAARRYPSRQRC